jgi:predicted small secreted protein
MKTLTITLLLALSLAACNPGGSGGPVEKAGRQADKAMGEAGKSVERAGKDMQDAAKGK